MKLREQAADIWVQLYENFGKMAFAILGAVAAAILVLMWLVWSSFHPGHSPYVYASEDPDPAPSAAVAKADPQAGAQPAAKPVPAPPLPPAAPAVPAATAKPAASIAEVLDKPTQARRLAKTLSVSPPTAGQPAAKALSGPEAVKLMQSTIAALGENGSDAAREELQNIVLGKTKTVDDRLAAAAVAKTWTEHPSLLDETFALRVVATAEQLRPRSANEAPAGLAPEELERLLLTAMAPGASEAFRTRVAGYATHPGTPPASRPPLYDFLKEAKIVNFPAQLLLYQCPETDLKLKLALEQNFQLWSSCLLARTLTIPLPPQLRAVLSAAPAGLPGGLVNAGGPSGAWNGADFAAYRIAAALWNPTFTAFVEDRMMHADSLGSAMPAILLGSTIPVRSTRATLARVLLKYWYEQPPALLPSGTQASSWAMRDPVALVVLKVVAAREMLEGTPPVDPAKLDRGVPKPYGAGSSGQWKTAAAEARAKQKEHEKEVARKKAEAREKAREFWTQQTRDMVIGLCKRFHDAAAGAPGQRPETERALADCPIALHPGAEVAVAYRCDWPGASASRLAGIPLDPMRIHYFRIEQRARPREIVKYYAKALRPCEQHNVPGGKWLSAVRSKAVAAYATSLDVLMAQAVQSGPGLDSAMDEMQELVIDVLAIEVKTAAREQSGETASGEK
ncbi:MAG: hypothetical protein ABSG68_01925 [Thermoguttaceae bacterium]|jgi:hypothetical protein